MVCGINVLNVHYCYRKSQTYKVHKIEFMSEELDKEDNEHDNKLDKSPPKEQDKQVEDVEESIQDVQGNEE